MADLILFWGEKNDASFTWMIDHQGSSQQNASSYEINSKNLLKVDLSCLADMLGDGNVTLVLSSKDIVMARIEVPNKAKKLLRKAVPYILEDEIASSVEDLFFAFNNKSEKRLLPVRAIARDYIETLIEVFKAAELKLEKLVVDIDLIDPPEEGMSLLLYQSECLVVESDHKCWNCYSDDFTWLVQKQFKAQEMAASKASGSDDELISIAMPLNLYSTEPTVQFVRQLPVGRFAVENHSIDNAEQFLANNIRAQEHKIIDLLQAEYEPKKENSQLTNFLLRVASILGFVLLTHVIYQSVQLYTLTEKKQQLEAQKLTLYKQAFPNRKQPSSASRAVKSMKSHVRSLGGGGDGGFLNILNSSTQKLTDLTKIYPTNINYDSARNELRMDLIASNLVVLDQYADELRKGGHTVSKSSETQTGEGYSSRLTISK